MNIGCASLYFTGLCCKKEVLQKVRAVPFHGTGTVFCWPTLSAKAVERTSTYDVFENRKRLEWCAEGEAADLTEVC
jgi:hypothetical protein